MIIVRQKVRKGRQCESFPSSHQNLTFILKFDHDPELWPWPMTSPITSNLQRLKSYDKMQYVTIWPWPLSLTYSLSLAKVKFDPHAKCQGCRSNAVDNQYNLIINNCSSHTLVEKSCWWEWDSNPRVWLLSWCPWLMLSYRGGRVPRTGLNFLNIKAPPRGRAFLDLYMFFCLFSFSIRNFSILLIICIAWNYSRRGRFCVLNQLCSIKPCPYVITQKLCSCDALP